MAGHSKWANIKHRKERQDSQKSKKFQKLVNEIQKVANSNPNPNTNSELKKLLELARKENLPKDVIQRTLKKSSSIENKNIFWCEAKFAKKINLFIKVFTDNFLKSLNNIKEVTKKSKINILKSSSIQHLFETKYKIIINKISEEKLFNLLEGIDLENIEEKNEKIIFIFNNSSEIKKLKNNLLSNDIEILDSLEILVPFVRKIISNELKDEYIKIKNKILEIQECKKIFDDLENEI